jgi:hypothetical protein
MFTREQIISEIQRVATEQGRPPGSQVFAKETGIRETDWRGRYWARWGDALADAGLGSNEFNARMSDEAIAEAMVRAIRDLGRFPTHAELKLRRRSDPEFPAATTLIRRGNQAGIARIVLDFCLRSPDALADVIEVVEPLTATTDANTEPIGTGRDETVVGQVYLLRLGQHYKLGRSNAFGRRERELSIQMPERATTVHVINTDDPVGIEGYWHRRFAEKRVRPDAEWFELSAEDVRAFKRRRFQ